jgi:hypothetical protein
MTPAERAEHSDVLSAVAISGRRGKSSRFLPKSSDTNYSSVSLLFIELFLALGRYHAAYENYLAQSVLATRSREQMFNEATLIAPLLEQAFDLDEHAWPLDTPMEVFYHSKEILAVMTNPHFLQSLQDLKDSSAMTRPWLVDTLSMAIQRESFSVEEEAMDTEEEAPAAVETIQDDPGLRSPPKKRSLQSLASGSSVVAGPSASPRFQAPAALPFDSVSSISRTTSLTGASHTSGGQSAAGSIAGPSSSVKTRPRTESKRKRDSDGSK